MSICYTPFEIPTSDTQAFFTAPGSMHNRAAVMSFADAHAESHKWVQPILRAWNPTPGSATPHPNPGNSVDVNYIRVRAHHLLAP